MSNDYDVVMIVDPELSLDDDPFPPDTPVQGIGGFSGEWPSFMAMIQARTDLERELKAMTKGWQTKIRPPVYVRRVYVAENGLLTVYGRLMSPGQAYVEERKAGSDMTEANAFLRRVRDAANRGWLYGTFYSIVTPKGETGCTHRCQIDDVLSAHEWRMAQESGWA